MPHRGAKHPRQHPAVSRLGLLIAHPAQIPLMSLPPRPLRRGITRVALAPRPPLQGGQLVRRNTAIMMGLLRRGQRALIRRRPKPPRQTTHDQQTDQRTNQDHRDTTEATVPCLAANRTAQPRLVV